MTRSGWGMTSVLLLLFLAWPGCPAIAVSDPSQILKIAPSAIDYPHAASVIMLDESMVVVDAKGLATTTNHQIARIFNQRGRGRAEVRLPFNASFERLKVNLARTIRKDGTVVDAPADSIREVELFPGQSLYSDLKAKTLSLPAVEDNCVIEYQWTVERTSPLMPGQFWEEWRGQDYDPVMLSRLSVTLPSSQKLKTSYHNMSIEPRIVVSPDGKTKTYVWEIRNSPAIEPEPSMPAFKDVAAWFGLTTVGSWNDIAGWFSGMFEPQSKADWDIDAAVKRLTVGKDTSEARAKAIFSWVESNIKSVGLESGPAAFKPHAAGEIYRNRHGDGKDQAVLLVTMLRRAGIEAYPALLLTADNPPLDKTLPQPAQFNHCIVLAFVDGKDVWLDPTAETVRYGGLPSSDQGVEAFVIMKEKGQFRKIPIADDDEKNSVLTRNSISLSEDGTIQGTVSREVRGDEEIKSRLEYKYSKPDQIQEGFQNAVKYISMGAKLQGYQVSDFRELDQRLSSHFSFTAPEWANRTRNFIIFRTTIFHDEGIWSPFSKPKRHYPIAYREQYLSVVNTDILLPEGFAVEELPEEQVIEAPFGRFEYRYRLDGRTLHVTKRIELRPAVIPPADYDNVRKIYEQLAQEKKRQVVLRKLEAH